jgi:hypothetical protein
MLKIMLRKKLWLVPMMLLLSFLGACESGSDVPPPVTDEPSPTAGETIRQQGATATPFALPTVPPTSSESEEPQSRPIVEMGLGQTGPWFVFWTDDGIWAANSDGTGLTQLVSQPMMRHFDHVFRAAPEGGRVAYLTARETYYDLTLNLLHLPQEGHQVVTKLTSPDTEPGPEALPGNEIFAPLRAVVEAPSMAWSPDGRWLAFMGVMEGNSSDLYVYSTEDGSIVRLTDGPSEGIRPTWSPDGEYIVHFGVTSMGTGAGANMSGAWAARADNASVLDLYDPGNSGDEIVLGWVDESTFVVHSWTAGCGPSNLRAYDLQTQQTRVLWKDGFDHIDLDPETGTVFLATQRDGGACNPEGKRGLYWLSVSDGVSLRVVEDVIQRLIWDAQVDLLFAVSEFGGLSVSPSGEFIDLDTPPGSRELPAASGASRTLAWVGEGLWIGPLLGSIDSPPEKIFDAPTYQAYWSPDGRHLLFFAEDGLYAASEPDFAPALVGSGVSARPWKGIWVGP